MRNLIGWLIGAQLIAAMTCASAQQQTKPSVNLTMEHRHTIVEVLKDANIPHQTASGLEIGGAVPSSVQLSPLPPVVGAKVPQIKEHMYFLTSNEIVLVNEKDRTIAEIIKRDGSP